MGAGMGKNRCQRILSVTLAIYGASLCSTPTGAQTAKTRTAKAPVAAAPAAHDCGNGVMLRLTGSSAQQGGLLELTLASTAPLGEIAATWAGNAVPFWEDGVGLRHALLGVDLERAPGEYDLSVAGQLTGGAQVTCTAQVDVKAGQFAVESLKVAPGFVQLSPEDQAHADKESQRIHGIFAQVTAERLWAGRFRMPLDGKLTGHNFGKRRVLNGKPMSSPHSGLDIPAPAGTPIHAAQHGRVALADNLFYSGNTVIIDHGLGVYTFYGHMKSIGVAEGDDVNAGDVIGQVGATGRATGPHLHWTLVVDGARVNPLGIVRLGPR
jgi:murein DD-endopeptidase MepM/ murein hydrolase activator NlpD